MDDVTMKQEVFCQEYIDSVGNGTVAAIAAFDITNKELLNIPKEDRTKEQIKAIEAVCNTASTMATEYLRKPNIIKRIDEILDERGFTDEVVKTEHFKLIKNSKDEVRMRAIDSYYKLKGKNAPDKVDLSTLGKPLYDDGQANKIASRIIERGKSDIGTSGEELFN